MYVTENCEHATPPSGKKTS